MGTNNAAHLEAGINITTTRIQMYLGARRYPIRSQKLLQKNWCVGFNIAVTKNRRLVTAEQFRTVSTTRYEGKFHRMAPIVCECNMALSEDEKTSKNKPINIHVILHWCTGREGYFFQNSYNSLSGLSAQ